MRISVYITSYNQRNYLIESINSVLSQTQQPYQIIIVDDASTDGSLEVISEYAKRYPGLITTIFHTENKGVAASRNDALNAVAGDWVCYVDGDDRLLPAKLEIEAKLLEKDPEAKITYSNYYVINAQGQRIDVWARTPTSQGHIFTQTFGLEFPKMRPFRDELVYYQAWKEIGFFDPALKVYEDWDVRIRLTKQLKVVYSGQILSEHRRLNTGLSKLDGSNYLQAFSFIKNKNQHLLDDLTADDRLHVLSKLDRFHAYLLRRMGRQALYNKDSFISQRINAWKYYFESLKVSPQLDIPFWLEFLLTPSGYEGLKSFYLRWNNSQFKSR